MVKLTDDAATVGVEDDVKRIIAVITPIAGLIASALGTLGGFTGSFTETIRNEPHLVWLAAGSILVGFVITGWAFFRFPSVSPDSQARRTRALSLALLAFGASFFFGVLATVRTVHNEQSPSLDVAWNAETGSLSGTVKAGALRTETQLFVAVYGMNDGSTTNSLLWRTAASADAAGGVSLPLNVAVQRGLFDRVRVVAWAHGEEPDCTSPAPEAPPVGIRLGAGADPRWTCAEIAIPGTAGPLWDVKAVTENGVRRLDGTVTGEILPTERVLIALVSMSNRRILFATEVEPRADGSLNVPLSVDLGNARHICGVAMRISQGDAVTVARSARACPAPAVERAVAAWVELRLPGLASRQPTR